ncbi:MAG: carbohydrate-binding protein, partial [Pseudorhizobium sp.]
MELTLKVVDAAGQVRASTTAAQEACLVFRASYNTGDRLVVETSRPGHLVLALDCAMGPALVYMKGKSFVLDVPSGARRTSYPPCAFQGELHRLHVRQARQDEIAGRRNLALNPFDDHGNASVFP